MVMVIRAQNTEATFFDTHFKTRVREDLIPVPICKFGLGVSERSVQVVAVRIWATRGLDRQLSVIDMFGLISRYGSLLTPWW